MSLECKEIQPRKVLLCTRPKGIEKKNQKHSFCKITLRPPVMSESRLNCYAAEFYFIISIKRQTAFYCSRGLKLKIFTPELGYRTPDIVQKNRILQTNPRQPGQPTEIEREREIEINATGGSELVVVVLCATGLIESAALPVCPWSPPDSLMIDMAQQLFLGFIITGLLQEPALELGRLID